ncbi:hypothetical protein OC834_005463 [Tilletia horrida]|nr:hypothetical protein OC834_005463 [Tilletia horrida]
MSPSAAWLQRTRSPSRSMASQAATAPGPVLPLPWYPTISHGSGYGRIFGSEAGIYACGAASSACYWGGWTALARLAVFRSHCSSLLDFGGGLVHHFAASGTGSVSAHHLSALNEFYAEAACWICDLPSNRSSLALSMSGLLPGRMRLEHLALRLELHLHGAHASNPARALLRRRPPPHAAPHDRLLASLRSSPLSLAFALARQRQQQRHPDWVPLSRRAFLRRMRRRWLAEHTGRLGAAVGDPHRLRNLADRILTIIDPTARLLATRWRAGTAVWGSRCLCGSAWSRGHVACLMDALGLSVPGSSDVADLTSTACSLLFAWARGQEALAHVHLIDFLLGHHRPEWHETGLATLQAWSASLRSAQATLPPSQHLHPPNSQ